MKALQEIAKLIDHTLLRPDATEKDVHTLCDEAQDHGFFSVCVHPFFIKTAADRLNGTAVKVCAVIGFPLGMTLPEVKIFEAREAVSRGAEELDTVINMCNIKAKRWGAVNREMTGIIKATPGVLHKMIIETHYLTDDEKIKVSLTALDAGAGFVKTSTGFAPGGAVVRDIEMIKAATKGRIGLKASGGIKTSRDLFAFIRAGADRIGTSSGTGIMKEVEHLEKA
jgi:deoxyribose-phosphate aldolase